MRDRALRIAKPAAVVLAAGLGYLLIHELTGFALFCPFRRFLHIYCPGCGVSRMFFHLAHLEWYEAFSSNCVAFCILPIAVVMCAVHAFRYIRYGDGRLRRFEQAGVYLAIGVLLVFAVVRNIYPAPLLIP